MIVLDRVLDPTSQRNFEKLAQLVLDTGGQTASVRFGTATVSWPGGTANSDVHTQAHGLAEAPVVLFVQPSDESGFHSAVAGVNGQTNIDIQVRRVDGTIPAAGATLTVYWLVIG